jgi:heptosyltransferase-2
MKKLPVRGPVAIGNHHSPLPAAVRACLQSLTIRRRRRLYPHQIKAILVRAVNWVGDAILTLPAIRQLSRFFPQARLSVLALERVAPVYWQQAGVAEVIPYLPAPPRSSMAAWCRHLAALRRRRFDLALVLPNSWESALVPWLAGIPHRVGYPVRGRGPLFTQVVQGPENLADLHQVYRHAGLLQAFGWVAADGLPELVLTPEEVDQGAALLAAAGWRPPRPLIGLSPGASYGPAKQWPPERFAAVATALQKKYQASIVLLGGAADRESAQAVAQAMADPPLNLVGQTTLRTAFAVIKQLQVLVTNDSGLMHAAAALWTPVVAIFGSTDPFATGPFTPYASVLWHRPPCGPCLQRTCPEGHYRCLDLITVAEVLDQMEYWLARRP